MSLSYGKDSIACLEAIKRLGYPIDYAFHAEIWATDEIPADLPPMVEFKKKADKIIMERYGVPVYHACATTTIDKKYMPGFTHPADSGGLGGYKFTYQDRFYLRPSKSKYGNSLYGFPKTVGSWCKKLKINDLQSCQVNISRLILQEKGFQNETCYKGQQCSTIQGIPPDERELVHVGSEKICDKKFLAKPQAQGADIKIVQYLGIAADETDRIEKHKKTYDKENVVLPLVDVGWTEAYCRKWCEENDLLSPIYTTATRGGCWFCHNQGVDQLRLLRKNYPELWDLLMKWDLDSPVTFRPDGKTVHDFDKRFRMEDEGKINKDKRFLWKYVEEEEQYQEAIIELITGGVD